WVVARRPSSRPAYASAKAPEQMLTTRAPRECARRSAWTTVGEGGSPAGSQPGMTTVSARSSASSPSVTSMSYPASVATGPGRSAHTLKVYRFGSPDRSPPNTCATQESSKVDCGGWTSATIRCMAEKYRMMSFLTLGAAWTGRQDDLHDDRAEHGLRVVSRSGRPGPRDLPGHPCACAVDRGRRREGRRGGDGPEHP